ncbi:peptidoglycan-binding protein [Actinorhabdospora filicis]|uniref:Peptidoglycan-binding protein n=1 Tax=Actinorhabdospora filicis TaxID=1785913 RepID=A0A9W6WE73_9ACTN|nr:peptidoglycan-binding protein [Actinorhabdospora filicis]GLZ81590.1 peptidoglycan-binding protein [Actinorhabdospora filicis]
MTLETNRTRRWLLTSGAAAVAGVAVSSALAPGAFAAVPAVDMEMVLLAAQVDPPKADTGLTPGCHDHVLPVEQALTAKGFLAASADDGHFGTSTISAYAAYQRSLGYTGIDANGLPGATSLTSLGSGRYTVTRPVRAGARDDSYGGKQVNARTADMLARADGMIAPSITLTQGSYNSSNPDSAGTHDGGGVVDISVSSMTDTQRWQAVKALRTVGFAAWLRTPADGFAYHIHAVAVSDPDLSGPAQRQVHDHYFGKNGLANHAGDNTPSAYKVPFTWWEKYLRG